LTNGLCPKTITRTWAATDNCGNSNTCSQTVTLRDTERPTITCPTNRIIVALDANCQLEIPTIRPSASDNCTPASQLVYTQNPSAGAIVPGPCQLVTVTVRDACDNASQCQVLVCGQDKTPPTLIYPKAVTVTNCFVPNVLALVSASDNCTASHQLVFTQSPPAGTAIAAGGNQVSVTVTDQAGNATTYVIPLINSGPNSFLDVMFNTGVDSNKVVLQLGGMPVFPADPHYTLGPVPAGTPTGPGYYNAPLAMVARAQYFGLPYTFSRWIAPGYIPAFAPCYLPVGSYTYTNQFTLPPGANPLTASISGRWVPYQGGKMYLNGLAPSDQISSIAPFNYPWEIYWTSFTVNSGFLAYPAVNKLYFVVTQTKTPEMFSDYLGFGYTGLRVEFTDAVINCSTCTPPVILLKTHNQSLPLNSTAVFSVSVGGTPPLSIQWYHNGLPLSNGGHYSGVNTPTLTITPLSYADAGVYKVGISNSCGETSAGSKLTITHGWPWWWAWWNFSDIRNPMKATVGPDLIMEGTNKFGFSFGTTRDFGLPNIGGQPANVMAVLTGNGTIVNDDGFIRMPFVAPPGSDSVSNYTVIMDFLVPDGSTNPVTLFSLVAADSAGGQQPAESMLLQVKQLLNIGDAAELSVGGTVGGTPFNLVSSVPLQLDAWNRVAVVMTSTGDDTWSPSTIQIYLYVNGKPAGSIRLLAVYEADLYWDGVRSDSQVAVFSSPDGTDGELYAASLQFHTVAFTPEMIAVIGSPDDGPIPANDPSGGVITVLEDQPSTGYILNDDVNLSWIGSGFVLQETRDLTRGVWMDSKLPFDEAEVNGEINTTAHANPALEGPAKFYRLIYAP
jgi:hypothetical protein